jgi:hypothetical protein
MFSCRIRSLYFLESDGVIEIFHWHTFFWSHYGLGVDSASNKNMGKCGRWVRITLPPSCAVVKKSGNLKFLEPSGSLEACNGTVYLFFFPWIKRLHVLYHFSYLVGRKTKSKLKFIVAISVHMYIYNVRFFLDWTVKCSRGIWQEGSLGFFNFQIQITTLQVQSFYRQFWSFGSYKFRWFLTLFEVQK